MIVRGVNMWIREGSCHTQRKSGREVSELGGGWQRAKKGGSESSSSVSSLTKEQSLTSADKALLSFSLLQFQSFSWYSEFNYLFIAVCCSALSCNYRCMLGLSQLSIKFKANSNMMSPVMQGLAKGVHVQCYSSEVSRSNQRLRGMELCIEGNWIALHCIQGNWIACS